MVGEIAAKCGKTSSLCRLNLLKEHLLGRRIEAFRWAREVEDDPSVQRVLSLKLASLLREQAFANLDLRAEYFAGDRKVERFRGQDKVKAIKAGRGIWAMDEEVMREGGGGD
eukprot:6630416-Pyramimonas_sp.AAC.1